MMFFLLIATVIIASATADDKCAGPFTSLLKCFIPAIDNKLQSYQQESSPQVQSSTKSCFSNERCTEPDFTKAKIEYFVPEQPWTDRVRKVLDILENMDPKVQKCMIGYFKAGAVKKVNECVQNYGSSDIKDFQMPPLPDIKALDISKLKQMVLNRMLVWNSLVKCGQATKDDSALQRLVGCVDNARGQQKTGSLCDLRDKCKKDTLGSDQTCASRFESVKTALCTCAKEETKKLQSSIVQNWSKMKDTLLQGPMEQQFKKCHTDNNVPYPDAKVAEVKQVIRDSLLDIIKQGSIPSSLKQTLATVARSVQDITDEWRNAFCSRCEAPDNSGEVKRIRDAIASQ